MSGAPVPDEDEAVLSRQIGRVPRRPFRVAVRCGYGLPQVIATPSLLEDGTPFPTLYWLTCPWLAENVSAEESAGGAARWADRLSAEPDLAKQAAWADASYRYARERESGGHDACAEVGVGGQARVLATKCLHAHVAALLAGLRDPVGDGVLADLAGRGVGRECEDGRCSPECRDG